MSRVRKLGELPQDIAPGRDLWPAIEAAIATSASRAGTEARRQLRRVPQLLALAASVAALAIGVWIGRSTLPVGPGSSSDGLTAGGTAAPQMMQAAYVTDPNYVRERRALVRALETRLAALPPETQTKVAASLQTIRQSMKDLEAALGRDPSNALLQELLVNTYQEEMRVLSVVNQAGSAREEI
ncbi:MAG: hypothetical protein ACRETT_10375 [Steroidobacteraceae bacterium]